MQNTNFKNPDMDIQDYIDNIRRIYPKNRVTIIANDKSLDVANYSYICRNLLHAKSVLELLIKKYDLKNPFLKYFKKKHNEHFVLLYSLFDSFIINYFKCFAKASPNKISLDYKQVYSSNKRLQDLHKEIEEMRNKFVAHDGDYVDEQAYCILVEDVRKKSITLETPIVSVRITPKEKLIEYQELLLAMYKFIEKKREKSIAALRDSFGI